MTFRLSPAEYDQLRKVCTEQGWRSISEFARMVVMQRANAHSSTRVSLGDDLLTLGSSLEEIEGSLTQLADRIRRVLGSRRDTEGSQGSNSPASAPAATEPTPSGV